MAPGPGPGDSEGGGGAHSGGWAWLASRGLHPPLTPRASPNCPFLSGLSRGSAAGKWPPRPSSWGEGDAVGRSCRFSVLLPSGAPSTLSSPGVFSGARRWEGRAGGRQRALPCYFWPQVLFHSRARALALVPGVPHPLSPVSVL